MYSFNNNSVSYKNSYISQKHENENQNGNNLFEPKAYYNEIFLNTWRPCYNGEKNKEIVPMSSMAVLNLGDTYIICSDSHSTECNGETNKQYQKIFKIPNGVLGVVGVNNITINGQNQNIGKFFQSEIKNVTSDSIFQYMNKFYKTYGKNYHNNIEIVFIFSENNTLHHEYYSISHNCLIHYAFIDLPLNDIKFYAQNYINFPKGNSEFLAGINENPENIMKRIIRYNEDVNLFVENKRYIGGAVQMYKIFKDGEIKNLSEAPFNDSNE